MVKHVEVGSDKFPVNYGMNALGMYSEMRSVSITDAFDLDVDKMNLMDLLTLIYVGLKDGARKAGEVCKFDSLESFLDYADDNNEIISKVAEVFASYNKEKAEGDNKKK